MVTDPISDLFTRIRNAGVAKHYSTRIRFSKMAERILAVLKEEGFIADFEMKKDEDDKFDEYEVAIKYDTTGEPLIREAKRISRPGKRVYAKSGDVHQVHHGLGISLISTSDGVISDRIARKKKIGGEVLASIS